MSESTTRRSTGSATKALVAAGLGVVLLAGAGGTFALWSAEESVGTGTITDGELSLEVSDGSWTGSDGEPITDISNYRMVPGDALRFQADVTPTIVGDNLQATLEGSFAGGGEHWDVTTTLPDGDLLTAADSGVAHGVVVTVSLDEESGNSSQNQSVDLGEITLTLQQVDHAAATLP